MGKMKETHIKLQNSRPQNTDYRWESEATMTKLYRELRQLNARDQIRCILRNVELLREVGDRYDIEAKLSSL